MHHYLTITTFHKIVNYSFRTKDLRTSSYLAHLYTNSIDKYYKYCNLGQLYLKPDKTAHVYKSALNLFIHDLYALVSLRIELRDPRRHQVAMVTSVTSAVITSSDLPCHHHRPSRYVTLIV